MQSLNLHTQQVDVEQLFVILGVHLIMSDIIKICPEALARISTFLGSKVNVDIDVKLYLKIGSPEALFYFSL